MSVALPSINGSNARVGGADGLRLEEFTNFATVDEHRRRRDGQVTEGILDE